MRRQAAEGRHHGVHASETPQEGVLYYTIIYYTVLYYTILHYTTLYYTVLYCTIL